MLLGIFEHNRFLEDYVPQWVPCVGKIDLACYEDEGSRQATNYIWIE